MSDATSSGRRFLLPDRALLERALALGARDPRIHRALADIARKERRIEDAIRHYQGTLAANPYYAEAHRRLGDALCALKRVEAIGVLASAVIADE